LCAKIYLEVLDHVNNFIDSCAPMDRAYKVFFLAVSLNLECLRMFKAKDLDLHIRGTCAIRRSLAYVSRTLFLKTSAPMEHDLHDPLLLRYILGRPGEEFSL